MAAGNTMTRTFARDERDEFAHALLHTFFCLLGDLRVLRERHFHNTGDWSKVVYVSIGL